MFYSQELVEEIRNRNDIIEVISSYIPLKQKGNSYFGLCPFHNESTPSFSVSPEKQLYYCFGCGVAGNVYSFVMGMENCDYPESVRILAEKANITLPEKSDYSPKQAKEELQKAKLVEIHKIAGLYFYNALQSDAGEIARKYLDNRKISINIQRKFGIGYASKSKDSLYNHLKQEGYTNEDILASGLCLKSKSGVGYYDRFSERLMFPIFDIQGKCIAFGGRILGKGEPKYLNSPETLIFNKKRNLYGLNFAKSSKKKEIILVEGYMDVISVYQNGFHNVAASLGTAFNEEHTNVLKRVATDVIITFDSDSAGENAALRAIPILIKKGFNVKVLQVPQGKDPDDFIKQNGSLEFSKLLVNAKNYMLFQIECAKKKYNMNDVEQKLKFTKEVANLVSNLSSSIEKDVYVKEISKFTNISTEAINSEISKLYGEKELAFVKEADKNKYRNYSKNISEDLKTSKGVLQAQRSLIYICATRQELVDKIEEYITFEEFIDDVYKRLAEIVFKLARKRETIIPATMVNYFVTPEEQKRVAEVFTLHLDLKDLQEIEKAVNDVVRIIKRANIDILAAKASTIEEVQQIVKLKKQEETLQIVI